MPDLYFEISDLNPLHFTDEAFVNPAKYNSKHIADWPYEDTVFSWMNMVPWYQPWQKSDSIKLQVKSQIAPITISLINADDGVLYSSTMDVKQRDRFQSDRFIYEKEIALAAIASGFYVVVLEYGSPLKRLVSNVFFIDDAFPDTLLLEYYHYKYRDGIYFESGFRPQIRIYGSMYYDKPGSRNVVYENQELDMTLVSGKTYNTWRLYTGASEGIPDFLVPKLNMVLCCSELSIDGRLYAKAGDNAQLEEKSEEGYPLRGWSIELRDRINRPGKIFTSTGSNVSNTRLAVVINVESIGFIQDGGAGNFEQILDIE